MERWSARSGSRDVVKLDIPPDAERDRRFEIYVRLAVANKTAHPDATHGLRVLVDGALEWARTAPTHVDGPDSLELRLHRVVVAGRPLRVSATCELKHAQRVVLTIEAEEA